MQDIKVGDTVHVRAEVTEVFDGHVRVLVDYAKPYVGYNNIVHVEPRALQVGDIVKDPDGMLCDGHIVHIVDDNAWVSYPLKNRAERVNHIECMSRLVRA